MKTTFGIAILAISVLVGSPGCARRTDATVSDAIKAHLFNDPKLRAEPVEISVANGEATLSGEVSSDEARQQLVDSARVVPGVSKVYDNMRVKPEQLAEATPDRADENPTRRADNPPATKPPVVAVPPPSSGGAPSSPPTTSGVPGPVTPPAAASQPPTPPPPPPPKKVVVPQGTEIHILTIDAIDSDKSKVGTSFLASLAEPITVGGEAVIPAKSNVYVKLLDAKSSGKVKGKSELQLGLESVEFQGKRVPLQSSTYEEEGKSRGKQTAKRVGIGAAVGTAVGAIAGGGKGAAIGAGIGGGAGLATQVFTKGEQVRVPSETKLDFTLEAPVEITIQPKQAKPTN
jgi:hypothetical protein